MTINLLEGERIDDLDCKGYKIIQHKQKFCFGMDAVLLADFARVKDQEKVLDLGTGTGVIPILLAAKTNAEHLTGLEIQKESAMMAARSVELNDLQHKIDIVNGDICKVDQYFAKSSFDVVTSNPPYMIGTHGLKSENESKNIARHEMLCTFDDVARAASIMLKPQGAFYLVHRPFRLAELFVTLKANQLEPKRMRLVYPHVEDEPNMVLIEARKGGNPRLKVEAPLIVYEADGQYTKGLLAMYEEHK